MKSVFLILAGWLCFSSCNSSKEIQVERVNVQLVRVDTIYRQSGYLKILTWQTTDRLRYLSIEPLSASYMPVGVTMGMLIRR
jgi:hypothetical protein